MLKYALLAAMAAVLVAGPVRAQDKGKPKKADPEAQFKKLDGNGDGKVSKEEFAKFGENNPKLKDKPEGVSKIFTKLDTNGDGALSLEEFKKFGERKKKADK